MHKMHDEQNINILEKTAPDRAEFGEGGESAKCKVGKLPAAYRGKGEAQDRLGAGGQSSYPSLPPFLLYHLLFPIGALYSFS